MSYVKAKQSFKDAQRAIKSNHDVALLGIVEGLLHLTISLENHVAELHSEIVRVHKGQRWSETAKAAVTNRLTNLLPCIIFTSVR